MKYDTYREAFKPEKTIYVVAVHCLRLSTNTNFLPQITILAYDGRSVGRVYRAVGLRLAVPLTLSKVVAIFKRKQYVEKLFF